MRPTKKIVIEASAVLVFSAALAWAGGIANAVTAQSPPQSQPCVGVSMPGFHVFVGNQSPPCVGVRLEGSVGAFSPPVAGFSPPR